MKHIYRNLTLLFLLFIGVYSCTDSQAEQMGMTDPYTTNPRWRIVSGFDASRIYTLYSHVREIALRPPLVNTSVSSDDDDSNGNLHALMKGVCELVTFYEHVSRTESGSLLHTLLTANMNDSCQWLNNLVSNHPDVTGSSEFSALPASCSPTDTTRLHHYCLQMKIRGNQLRNLVHWTADALHTHFQGVVPLSRPGKWINSSSIPAEQKSRIQNILGPDFP